MTAMISEVYEALLEAGASPAKAVKAVEAVAAYDNRFARNERETVDGFVTVDRRFNAVDVQLAKLQGELGPLKWMMGFALGGVGVLIVRTFFS